TLVYMFTEREVVKKLQNNDLVTLGEAMSLKVDARIDKASETSLALAHDPILTEWLASGEKDAQLQNLLFQKTQYLRHELNYSTTFTVIDQLRQYWDANGKVIDQVSQSDPADSWFLNSLPSVAAVSLNFDYNRDLGDSFAFTNTLVGPV